MNVKTKKNLKIAALFVAVVAVSATTNIVTNRATSNQNAENAFKTNNISATYAAFATAPSGLETDFTLAADLSIHAVVHVKVKTPVQTQQSYGFDDPIFEYFFGRPNRQQQQQRETPMREGSGSGVIISQDGYIVTNNHVIDNAKFIDITLNDKRTFQAKLVGADPNTDIALLKIEAENLPTIGFGNSDSLKVGEWVLAVGNPFSLTSTVTAGIVSAKARTTGIIDAQMPIESFIQTDAAVNPGNSGGALVNTKGELMGINTALVSQTGNFAGIAFAIPSSIVQKVITDIRQYGIVQRAMLGIQMGEITENTAKEKNLTTREGVYVKDVVKNSAAEAAKIKVGDIITKINNVKVKSPSELSAQIGRYSPSDKISISVLRDNKEVTLNAELKNLRGNTDILSQSSDVSVLGAEFKDIDRQTKNRLQLNYGVEVKAVTKGKFQQAGIKAGFVIVKINNQAVRSTEDINSIFEEVIGDGDSFKDFNIAGIYPNGRVARYSINLGE